jgi:hypothetical protein
MRGDVAGQSVWQLLIQFLGGAGDAEWGRQRLVLIIFGLLRRKRLIFPSGRIGNFVWWWAKCPLILGGHLLGVGR